MYFLDTGYFKGLMDKKDANHKKSLKIKKFLDDYNEHTVINTTVVVETLNWSVKTGDNVEELYRDLFADNQVILLTEKDYLKSIEVNGWFENSINYSDCTIINTMMDMGIRQIVSFDEDFKKIKPFEVLSSI